MIERPSSVLPDRIYADILNRIIEGDFKEGERLPTENELAERFATSRPTIREGARALRADGIVVTRHGSGTTWRGAPIRTCGGSHRSRRSPISSAAMNSAP